MEQSTTNPATPSIDRGRALANSVRQHVAQGWRVESQTTTDAILAKGKGCSHVLHLLLTCVTFGLWALVWPIVWYVNREQHLSISVDDYGNTLVSKL